MPFYIVTHKDPIEASQRDELAAAITKTHTTLFTTPSLFVNVRFEDASALSHYVGGKPNRVNAIRAHVRAGPARSQADFNELTRQIRGAWETVFPPQKGSNGAVPVPRLDMIQVLGTIVAGEEQGILLPEAGKDAEWVRENMAEFKRRAAEGNGAMRELVEECKTRGLGV